MSDEDRIECEIIVMNLINKILQQHPHLSIKNIVGLIACELDNKDG